MLQAGQAGAAGVVAGPTLLVLRIAGCTSAAAIREPWKKQDFIRTGPGGLRARPSAMQRGLWWRGRERAPGVQPFLG